MKEKMVFIAASENPNILKLTPLQLIFFWLNCLRISSFVKVFDEFSVIQEAGSLKKPC